MCRRQIEAVLAAFRATHTDAIARPSPGLALATERHRFPGQCLSWVASAGLDESRVRARAIALSDASRVLPRFLMVPCVELSAAPGYHHCISPASTGLGPSSYRRVAKEVSEQRCGTAPGSCKPGPAATHRRARHASPSGHLCRRLTSEA